MKNPFPFAEQIVTSRYDLIKQTAQKLDEDKKRTATEQEQSVIKALKTTEQLWLC